MSTVVQTKPPSARTPRIVPRPAGVGRDPVPERGREHRGLRDRGARGARRRWACRARWSSPTTTPRTTPRGWPSRPARAWWSSAGAATAAPTWPASRPRKGRYIVMADADLTYDFNEIPRFVAALEEGAEMVIGDRMDNIQPGAMPWLHRYVGNPILTGCSTCSSAPASATPTAACARCAATCCRAWTCARPGMEFASEMVIRASKENLRIAEFPIEYHPRGGESKLSSFRDGWRHLRFLLVHSPNHLFIVPGAALAGLGTLIVVFVGAGLDFFGRAWGLHALIGGALLMIVGTQVLALGLCAHAYGTYFMGEKDPWFDRMRARFRPRARPAARRRLHARRGGDGSGDRGDLDLARLRLARRRTPRGGRRLAVDRRHPDLLLVLPAVDPRSAPQFIGRREPHRALRPHGRDRGARRHVGEQPRLRPGARARPAPAA